jgi:mono/diheme cytochrome c family protein
MHSRHLSLILLLLGTAFETTTAAPGDGEDFDKAVRPFLDTHCVRCHGPEKQKGEFRVDTLVRDFASPAAAVRWGDVLERLNTGEMPPKKEPKPKPEESARIVEWVTARLKEGEAARTAKRERVTFHKLTREEYADTVRDLLGVRYDAADPTGLPEDPNWHGFERIGSVLSLSPAHVEKYFAAAEGILAEAFPEKAPKSKITRWTPFDCRGWNKKKMEEQGLADKVRLDLWPGIPINGHPGSVKDFSTDSAGEYRIRVKLSGLKPANGRAPRLSLYAADLDRLLGEQDVIAPEDKPIVVEITTHLPAGRHMIRISNEAPGPGNNLDRGGRHGSRPFISIKDGREPWQWKLTDEQGLPLWPVLIVDWVEWEGPLSEAGPTAAQRDYFPAGAAPEQVREILARFATRAFRRPARPAELDRLVALVERERKSGEPFAAALKTGLLAVLCSKDFFYLVEGAPDRDGGKITDWELASRLSYFLWSTLPDAPLLEAARDGSLRRPDILRSQIQRMLGDPRIERFAAGFPRQWLRLGKVGMFPPDKKLYPDYDEHLQKSMVQETTATFREVLFKNLSLREFLDSDWTMLNARLAEHYGISGVEGDAFRRVSLAPETHRGGLLTQASILSLTSDGTRHRPVHRGVWVMESILGRSPPPPPANVPPIEPTPAKSPKATLRMKLDAHKSDPNCAACHRKIDPLGFAFDAYDAIGRWRTIEVVRDGAGDNPKVDASGELPDGRKYTDAAEFKKLLLADVDKFNAAFLEKLATYALRRGMSVDDRAALAELTRRSKAADYRLGAIVEALALSELFQKR